MITVSLDKSIIVTEISTNKTLYSKQHAHSYSIIFMKKIKDNSFLTACSEGYVKLWEWINNEIKLVAENRIHNSTITFLDYYPKFNLIVTSSSDGVIHFTDPTDYT